MARADKTDHLTRSIELLWGGGTPGRRGPKPRTSVEQIARAGIRLADAEGLSAVSMQRVAAELGFTAMSLYTYVPSKDLLLEVMLDLVAEADGPPAASADWRAGVHAWVRDIWELFAAHPWVLEMQVSGPPLGPHQMGRFERLLTLLLDSGLPPAETLDTGMFLLSAVRGMSKLALDVRGHGGAATNAEVDAAASHIVTPERFPALHTVFSTAETGDAAPGPVPGNLHYGVDRLLDGVAARVDRPATEKP